MAKKVLSIVLAVAMLLGTFAVASFAGDYYPYTPEEAEEEVASKWWYDDNPYDADVDWKDEIDRRWLTGSKMYDGSAEETAPQEILEYNLYFWDDEIIAEYNAASSNEDYWNLYNKMATPEILYYTYDNGGEKVTECDIFYDYAYKYRDESKAVMDVNIVADKEYAKPGDVITVEVYGTSNFKTGWVMAGIFYDKTVLTPLTVEAPANDNGWIGTTQLDQAVEYNEDGSIKADRRSYYWPEAMYTEENLAKYGVSFIYSYGDNITYKLGEYVHGVQFDNDLLFTATYEVKEGVADGTEIEFFVPDDVTANFQDVGNNEQVTGKMNSIWSFYRVDYAGMTKETFDLVADFNSFYDQTVTANTVKLTIGEEKIEEPAVKGEIVDVYQSEAFVGDVTEVDVEVTGSPEALHFMEANGGYKRVARETATITEFNGNELWTVDLFVEDELLEYTVYADYGELGSTDGKEFVIVGQVKKDLSIHSIEIPDMYPDAKNGGVITAGKHDVIIKTSTDVVKIQFYAEDGTSYTYTSWSGAGKVDFEDVDGERVWTIPHSFGPFGYRSMVIRTRSAETFFAATNSTLDATVVY